MHGGAHPRHAKHEKATESKVKAWAAWLMSEGRARGLRTPSPDERARAVGLGGCCASLGIAGRRLFDAVGMRFDPRCLQRRMVCVILA
eukprot:7674690-Pyramimonas_sp.AAC.1